jgi:DNA-binding transcriptional ArsR family regulator
MTYNTALDRVFHALADPTRRGAIERLGAGPAAVTDLFGAHGIARLTMLQHGRVLEQSGLIRTQEVGRRRICHLNRPAPRMVHGWLDAQRALWDPS